MGPKRGMTKVRASTGRGASSSNVPTAAQILAVRKTMQGVTTTEIRQFKKRNLEINPHRSVD